MRSGRIDPVRVLVWVVAPLVSAAVIGFGVHAAFAQDVPPSASPVAAPTPPVAEVVPRALFQKAVYQRRQREREIAALRVEIRTLRAALHDHDLYAREAARWRVQFLCIALHESGRRWDIATGNGYFGGLQMDRAFAATYGPELYFRLGTPDHWSADQQIAVASRAVASRGFTPWPQTARMCGLL